MIVLSLCFIACQQKTKTIEGNATILGEVISLESGHPLANAKINLFYHNTRMFQEGLWIGEPSCETPSQIVYTNKDGLYKIDAMADTTGLPTYVWLYVTHPKHEGMHELFVHIDEGANTFGRIELRKPRQFVHLIGNGAGPNRKIKYKHAIRNESVFSHKVSELAIHFPKEKLSKLPSIKSLMPNGNYVKYYDLRQGYNAHSRRNFNRSSWNAYTNVMLPLDLAMAGVTEGEVGLFTDHPEALKTQAIWARTYALYKGMHLKVPQNFQLAFRSSISDNSLKAGLLTSREILTHPNTKGGNGNPIQAVFSARCNGDFTQPGELAKWSGCALGGNKTPYLQAVPCSNHPNCHQAGMTRSSCCNIDGSEARYIYGHGAGGCQHGMRDYAEKGLDYRQIAPYFFSGSKIMQYRKDVW